MKKSDISRFVLEDREDVIIRQFGHNWLKQPVGQGRTLPAQFSDVLMTKEEFLEKSTRPT